MVVEILAYGALAIWLYLLLLRGGFWRCAERDEGPLSEAVSSVAVTAVVPARNEAAVIERSIGALLRQDHPGRFSIVLVDDDSSDGTGDIARRIAATPEAAGRLRVVKGGEPPPGWTGKLWAVQQGVDHAMEEPPVCLLLTDADIVHPPDSVSRLVARAQAERLVLLSLMVKLRCESLSERATIPAFVFFFQMVYPFAWVNRAQSAVAAAAGGCMLVRAEALAAAGGVHAIRGALIDDCALAKLLKRQGPIRLALTERIRSIRSYGKLGDIRRMVARSAYAQLDYSPLRLLGATAAMLLAFLAPPLISLLDHGLAQAAAVATWALMALAFQPTLRLYRCSPVWGIALPAIALLYLFFTLDSAWQHVRGRGGSWKGRVQTLAEPG